MNKTRRSFLQFNTRPQGGHISAQAAEYSSGFVGETDSAYGAVSDDQIIAEALRILSKRMMRATKIQGAIAAQQYVAMRFAGLEHEVFTGLFMDCRCRLLACEDLFRGTIDTAHVYSREVVKRALAHNAAYVIFAHNHPSGVAEPSQADELITRRLQEALALIDVKVLDHLVVAGSDVTSFSERGLL